jgi:hypothetical protein
LPNLGNGVLKAVKKTKEKREEAPLLSKVGDDVAKATKKHKTKGELSSFSTETW